MRPTKLPFLIEKYSKDEEFLRLIKEGTKKQLSEYTGLYIGPNDSPFMKLITHFGFVKKKDKRIINPPELWDEFTAYFLGYFLGDGNIPKGKYGQIGICSTDRDVVDKINKLLSNSTIPIRTTSYSKIHPYWKDRYDLLFTSYLWKDFFLSHGLVPNKSHVELNLRYPPFEVFHHFVRGLFDSDGGLNVTESSQFQIRLYGSSKYIGEISNMIPVSNHLYKDKNPLLSVVVVGTRTGVLEFVHWMYKDATIYMDRKFNIIKDNGFI
jgi:hypothetical protein